VEIFSRRGREDGEAGSSEPVPHALREHAWFVAGVLNREPRLVVAVLLEHVGMHGGEAAGPIVKDIFKYYYFDRPKDIERTKNLPKIAKQQ